MAKGGIILWCYELLNQDNREKKGKEDLLEQREKGEEGTKQWDAESESEN